ncbi:putative cation-transporting ATPase F [Mycobacterium innocens]|uniref:Probable cation-transporting ATPase F n=1 Tax=Mycobacterium innocens TaxID=2341083 RepID=A0A498PSQ1_9MYCO|nr:HAD-IC family P-type ATPase [Mycobacterium innocens]VBA34839.1 putative cation-transporting ATPase F [Mycobacterium innocens]
MPESTAHHGLSAHEVVLLLETDPHRGLSGGEAAERLERFGPNTLPVAARGGLLVRILRQFHHPLIYVLLAAGLITAGLREYVDSAVIFGVVVVNAIVGFIQESKAEAALEGLRSMVRTQAKVVRGGHEHTVPSEDLVPGDLVLLESGDKVPADLRLVRVTELHVNESALTGESVPVHKDAVALPEATPVADRCNMVYSGTLVTAGHGAGIAVATGAETELGEIHRLVGAAETLMTPLTAKLAWFSKVLTIAILALAAATFAAGLLRRQDAVETFTAAIALAVGAIPEGLPAAVTITLAIGVARMAKRRAVIRRLPAVETLGSTTVICSDKTGTMTENQMTVQMIWTPDGMVEMTGTGYAPDGVLQDRDGAPVSIDAHAALRWSLIAGARCNDAALSHDDGRWSVIGDPTEGAMLVVAAKAGPPRAAASSAVAACHTAGIAVKMITGDHAGTATAIAAKVGLLDDEEPTAGAVLTGAELAALSSDEYPDAVDRAKLFARVSPEQKLRLVQALQARGHVVAMTGDGVNDAPALRQANIGVAMGLGGTEVAKDAADMVLADDDFATIEAAVEEGREVFDNLTKFITWTLPTNIGEGLVILVAIAVGATLPILPTQILWINMTTAVALGLMLAFEPKEAGIMARPPRDPDQPLLTRGLVARILLVATMLVATAWWLFEWEIGKGASVEAARTAALNLFVVVEAFYLFSCRSLTHSAFRIGVFSNRWIIVGVTVQAVAQLAITYLPAMNTVFGTAPIGAPAWIRIFAFATGVTLVVAVDKLLRRGRCAHRSSDDDRSRDVQPTGGGR